MEKQFKKVELLEGQPVFDRKNKSFGHIINNYGNPYDGDLGEVRLDSNGNQSIFEFDSEWNVIGYNLVRIQDMTETELLAAVVEAETSGGFILRKLKPVVPFDAFRKHTAIKANVVNA